MSDNIIASYKAILASQKQTLKTQLITQEKLGEIEASNARIEAGIERIEAKLDTLVAMIVQVKAEIEDQDTFGDLIRVGEEDVDQLGAYIEAYNQGDRNMPLHEYLGLTAEELVALLERPEDADEILGLTDAPEAE